MRYIKNLQFILRNKFSNFFLTFLNISKGYDFEFQKLFWLARDSSLISTSIYNKMFNRSFNYIQN